MELKCNVSLVDRLYRRTALHIAAESNPEMIPLLLEAGFIGWVFVQVSGWNRVLKNCLCKCTWKIFQMGKVQPNHMICRSGLDVEARADMNVTDKRGQTPLCLGALGNTLQVQ